MENDAQISHTLTMILVELEFLRKDVESLRREIYDLRKDKKEPNVLTWRDVP